MILFVLIAGTIPALAQESGGADQPAWLIEWLTNNTTIFALAGWGLSIVLLFMLVYLARQLSEAGSKQGDQALQFAGLLRDMVPIEYLEAGDNVLSAVRRRAADTPTTIDDIVARVMQDSYRELFPQVDLPDFEPPPQSPAKKPEPSKEAALTRDYVAEQRE